MLKIKLKEIPIDSLGISIKREYPNKNELKCYYNLRPICANQDFLFLYWTRIDKTRNPLSIINTPYETVHEINF